MKRIFSLVFASALVIGDISASIAAAPSMPVYEPAWMLVVDTRAARSLNAYRRDGFRELDRQYEQIKYLAKPKQDYLDGEYQIIFRNNSSTDRKQTYYAIVYVDVMINVSSGRYYAGREWSEDFVFER